MRWIRCREDSRVVALYERRYVDESMIFALDRSMRADALATPGLAACMPPHEKTADA